MSRSSHYRLARAAERLVRTIEPPAAVEQRNAVNSAVGRDGRIVPGAIPASTIHLSDSDLATSGASTSSTSVYATAATLTMTLPTGRWKVRVNAIARIHNTGGGNNVDAQLLINGEVVSSDTRSAPSSAAAPMHLTGKTVIDDGGEVLIEAQVKSASAGTSSMTNILLEWFADRL